MKRTTRLAGTLLLACSALMTTPVMAHDYTRGTVKIDHPWSRPTPPGMPMGVGYMAITNNGTSDITFTSARTPRAKEVSIHESRMTDGVMSMRTLENGLIIPAGETVELKPHSYHLMLEKLKGPLKEGESIPLTVSFDGAETMDVELNVESLDGAAVPEKKDKMDMQGHEHH
ncbi:copper chaperone PCu(A)C [Marinobacter sp. GN3S48]|uniref:copper chaperone PCu(A)C n=1 Tax=Marinobacter sp. GN3S48 TaxID=3382302 RepID=UPI00387B1A83